MDTWVVPDICPHCDHHVTLLVMLIVCVRCGRAYKDYEFLGDWRERIPADIRAVWEIT
jgi:hypothetical protein